MKESDFSSGSIRLQTLILHAYKLFMCDCHSSSSQLHQLFISRDVTYPFPPQPYPPLFPLILNYWSMSNKKYLQILHQNYNISLNLGSQEKLDENSRKFRKIIRNEISIVELIKIKYWRQYWSNIDNITIEYLMIYWKLIISAIEIYKLNHLF